MPPEIPPLPAPTMGAEAIPFLSHHGIIPRSPTLRSSDFKLASSSPFLYYLTRRLGIARRWAWSAALSRGSWAHKCLELDSFTTHTPGVSTAAHTLFESALTARLDELRAIAASMGTDSATVETILERERLDARTAQAWYSCISSIPISPTHGNFRAYLSRPCWRDLGAEIPITTPHPIDPTAPGLRGTLDRLFHNVHTNQLWILDLKSTALNPRDRLSLCSHEFQTAHYLFILKQLLSDFEFLKDHDLPPDVTVGGMMHIAFQKPPLVFGTLDRPCKFVDFTPTRGPNKGITRSEKEYYGEPSSDLFIERCLRWYRGTHEYSHLAPLRELSPPVNISFTPISILDNPAYPSYTARINFLTSYATCEPFPDNFPYDAVQFQTFKKLSPWAPFALCPVADWPEIMTREGFLIAHRDEEFPDAVPEEDPSDQA